MLINEFKMDIDEVDIDGMSALAHVYEEYRKDIMIFLINNGADINLPCLPSNKTMLLDACHRGYKDLVEFFLKRGASTEVKCSKGKNLGDYIKTDY